MNKKKAKLKYRENSFDIIEEGNYVSALLRIGAGIRQ